ncbi:protein POLYCHOME-like [Pistacia vera]|uniref:protein POLYCHOME-like n=1 Tax=Pistacia vera TaxID=55513 RepID=UPI001263ACA4|nr:protein POLYCHOME-like [Pistacia vera]
MPESRDRLVRPVDIATVFAQRRSETLGILRDEPEQSSNHLGSPATRVANTTAARGQSVGGGRGGGLGTPRSAFGRGRRNGYGFASATRGPMGRENTPIGSARRGSSVLPAWYPRTPLRDITTVVRAIERRRARLGEVEGLQMESPMSQDQRVVGSPKPLSGAQPEHNTTILSPTMHKKLCQPSVGKVPKILLDITNQAGGELESLTPQKKLLNSIDKVERVVMEELNKLKRTPSARKAEREKRVRTLMSMR